MVDGRDRSVSRTGLMTGTAKPLGGVFCLPRVFKVASDQCSHFINAFAALFDQPGGQLAMISAPGFFQETFIGDISQQVVFERVLERSRKGGGFTSKD